MTRCRISVPLRLTSRREKRASVESRSRRVMDCAPANFSRSTPKVIWRILSEQSVSSTALDNGPFTVRTYPSISRPEGPSDGPVSRATPGESRRK